MTENQWPVDAPDAESESGNGRESHLNEWQSSLLAVLTRIAEALEVQAAAMLEGEMEDQDPRTYMDGSPKRE
jgi:hypothetical protein